MLEATSQPVAEVQSWVQLLLPSLTVLLGLLAAWLRRRGGQHAEAVRLLTDAIEVSTYDVQGQKQEVVSELKRVVGLAAKKVPALNKIVQRAAGLSSTAAGLGCVGSYKLGRVKDKAKGKGNA